MKKGDIVRLHTPLSNEGPNSRYLLLDEPRLKRVDIQYLGEMKDGVHVPTDLTFAPIQRVDVSELEVAEDCRTKAI
jgi:hypothetical protein